MILMWIQLSCFKFCMFSCTVAKCIEFSGGGTGILMLMWLMSGML